MTGYRLCSGPSHAGPRWCRVTDFGYRYWDPLRDEPVRLCGHCKACERMREQRRGMTLRSQLEASDPLVDATAFRGYLQNRCVEYSIANVAASVGVDPRRISAVMTQRRVYLSTVDRWAAAFGDNSTIVGYYPK